MHRNFDSRLLRGKVKMKQSTDALSLQSGILLREVGIFNPGTK